MAGAFYLVLQALAALAFFGLAGLLLVLRFGSRVNRSFAFVLVLIGFDVTFKVLKEAAEEGSAWRTLMSVMDDHTRLGEGFALAFFLVAYFSRGLLASRLWRWMCLGLGLAAQAWFTFDHCALRCSTAGTIRAGPLLVLMAGLPAVFAAAGILLLWEAGRGRHARAASGRLMGLALTLNALFDLAVFWSLAWFRPGLLGAYRGQFWAVAWWTLMAVGLVASLVALTAFSVRCLKERQSGRAIRWSVVMAAVLFSGIAVALVIPVGGDGPEQLVAGAWRIALPALVVFALVRHHLFGLEVTVRKGIARGAIVAIFLAVFFVTSKMMEILVTERWPGVFLGGLAAGLLLLLLKPLEHLGDWVADLIMPETRHHQLPEATRVQLYEDMAKLLWEDGVIASKERILLDEFRKRLGLTAERATELELGAMPRTGRRANFT